MEEKEKMKRNLAIGIDIGATTIKGGVVDITSSKILIQQKVDTFALQGPGTVLRQLNFLIKELMLEYRHDEFTGIGIGAPGIVENDNSTVKNPPNFTDWTEIDLGGIIHKGFRLPVIIENDANAAALGESKFGAGIDYQNFLFVIWGTGVGGGIILDNKIYRGPFGGAGEIGHTTIDYNGHLCNCGNRGCIESYIGQRYLSERTRQKLTQLPKDAQPSKIFQLVEGNLDLIEPYIISVAAEQGDVFAKEILLDAGNLLGIAIASVLNVLDLRIVVVGGGISAAGEFVFNAITNSLRSRVLTSIKPDVKVIPAKLGNAAGIFGAASLVMNK
ncbi:MAG: ROK family protein [Bacteroidota bacterium]|nr:ROK family protein [Bacteroidota bacterium]